MTQRDMCGLEVMEHSNNGLFLAASKKYDRITTLGKSAISSLFGEGLGMQFDGPCTVYTQSKNMNELVTFIAERLPPAQTTDGKTGLAGMVLGNMIDGDSEQEGGKRPRQKTQKMTKQPKSSAKRATRK